MRIATFNVENLFLRARVLNLENWTDGRAILDAHAELTNLLEQPVYGAEEKTRIILLLDRLGLLHADEGPYVLLRRNRGGLIRRNKEGMVEIVAGGRDDWIGWVELVREPINEVAIENTARVIADVNADILCVVEAESRTALREFSEMMLPRVQSQPYDNIMLIDGNDTRGIDVGLMTRAGYDIGLMRSHVGAGGRNHEVFSRDCPEYAVHTPRGEQIWCLLNHFKSKGYGRPAESDARRRAQAKLVASYYRRLRSEGKEHIVVMGDLNDTPGSAPLAPLLEETDLKEISTHPAFSTGEFSGKGTFGLGNDSQKLDHLLLSPGLFARVTGGGIFRMGAWPGSRERRWTVYPELEKPIQAASDHHALWVDID
ncbi:endonuclease/exonuclease/phosphatase family protein [Tabrizicola sp. J26]|uniref:endonuclease/exonuclease/phosphatase family protein n=1 Tax=Alitabrizicola rongguiensis TaxID=2909234 RepID=UPI001F186AB2|nr:endonuclease/exonuclease/phosphatase family protein [Tabrizicola rongguiensis]MCF1710039.1 endonuclease/exonuclease/phosphatase family protein [Tabrizicola rongguiensis]